LGHEAWNKGRRETRPEVLQKISAGSLGRDPWNRGYRCSDEEKANMLIVRRRNRELKHLAEMRYDEDHQISYSYPCGAACV
jgi:hypothetical protein